MKTGIPISHKTTKIEIKPTDLSLNKGLSPTLNSQTAFWGRLVEEIRTGLMGGKVFIPDLA